MMSEILELFSIVLFIFLQLAGGYYIYKEFENYDSAIVFGFVFCLCPISWSMGLGGLYKQLFMKN